MKSELAVPVLRVVKPKPKRFLWQLTAESRSRRIRPEDVHSWVREECGDRSLPSAEQCELLADELTEIACMGLGPGIEPALGLAQKHGRLFLHHLPRAIEKMQALSHNERALQGLEAMQSAEREVRRLLQRFDYSIKQPSWHDMARSIAFSLRKTLETSGRAYKDVNENSPLCLIVTKVLAAMGHHKQPSAVSEALRGRRGKGRSRNKSRP